MKLNDAFLDHRHHALSAVPFRLKINDRVGASTLMCASHHHALIRGDFALRNIKFELHQNFILTALMVFYLEHQHPPTATIS